MIGTTWGHWLVLEESERDRHGNRKWRCRCACGAVSVVYQNALRGGKSTQCDLCGRKQSAPKRAAASVTHGRSGTLEYGVWDSMLHRCNNPKASDYARYGGRGIRVCGEWTGDGGFERFFAHVGLAPTGTTIDRIDNERGYEPGNVRWSTSKEQARNRRNNRLLEFNGREMCLEAWSEETGLPGATIRKRLDNYGFSIEEALTRPLKGS